MSITKNELKSVTALLSKKGRKETGLFVAEGIRLLEEALRHKYLPQKIYHSQSLLSKRGQGLVQAMEAQGVPVIDVSAREMRTITDTDAPQGVIAVFATPKTTLAQLSPSSLRRLLWCENVSDPGNLGTLLRSALAFGFDPVILSGDSANAYAPKVVRSSAGAVFALRVTRGDTDEVLKFARSQKAIVVATGRSGKKLDSLAKKVLKKEKLILALGSEGHGLSEEITKKATMTLRLDHSNRVESLNVAVAGSIIMNTIYTLVGAPGK